MKNTLWIVGLNLALLFSTVTAVAQTNITQVKITPVKRDKSSSDFITAFGKNLIRSTGLMMLERANYPDGVQKSATKKECQPFMFENELINSESPQIFSKKVKQLFAKCESTWRNLNTPGLLGLLEFSNAEYDFSKNEKINAIEFQFANGFHLKGYIAVQDEQVKRPWVIIKCGVFCAATESGSMRNFMMNLFDESPFNIIILGNRTGDDFIKENGIKTSQSGNERKVGALLGYWFSENNMLTLSYQWMDYNVNATVTKTGNQDLFLNEKYYASGYGLGCFRKVTDINMIGITADYVEMHFRDQINPQAVLGGRMLVGF